VKQYFLIASLIASTIQATVEISPEQAADFFRAVSENSLERVQAFLETQREAGGDAVVALVRIENDASETPLHLAHGPEIFEVLVNNSARLDARDAQGRLPLFVILLQNNLLVFESILRQMVHFSARLVNVYESDPRHVDYGAYRNTISGFIENVNAIVRNQSINQAVRLFANDIRTQLAQHLSVLDQARWQLIEFDNGI